MPANSPISIMMCNKLLNCLRLLKQLPVGNLDNISLSESVTAPDIHKGQVRRDVVSLQAVLTRQLVDNVTEEKEGRNRP